MLEKLGKTEQLKLAHAPSTPSTSKSVQDPKCKHTCQVHKHVTLKRCTARDSVHTIGTRNDARYSGISWYHLPRDNCKRRPQNSDEYGTTWDTSAKQPPTLPSASSYGVKSPSTRCSPPAVISVATSHQRWNQTRKMTALISV